MYCDICGQIPEAYTRYDDVPFLDGNYYDIVCFTCCSLFREYEYDINGNIIWYGFKNHNRIATLQMMVKDGWDEEIAKCSIMSINKLIKKANLKINYEYNYPLFNLLMLID